MADRELWLPASAREAPGAALSRFGHNAASRGRADDALGPDPNAEVIKEMRLNRRVNAKLLKQGQVPTGVSPGRFSPGASQLSFATARPRDPLFYWKQNNMPWDVSKAEELEKIREYCRILYMTHPIISSAIDIYSKYPLTGMELVCKDEALTEFYTTLFFDQLDYEEYLVDVGREYWTVGEAWPLGSFNDTLGVWEDDELINPDDVEVIRSPFLKEPRFEMRLPETIRNIIKERSPKWEFEALMRTYPELRSFVGDQAKMPVSNILLKQMKFKADTFHPRGLPLLMRGFRAVMQEEMLNAAQDAIADRLYTPLILAKLGASATDLGTQQPWIPTDDDLADFEESLDAALAADFRVLTHHFALEMGPIFGKEAMPNFDADFDRLTKRILQPFGLSETMLSGAGDGETYAADALNRDLVSQLLTTYQRRIQRLYKDRALVVAEAQEHYDYDERGGKKYPVMEEVLEVDEETGEQRIVEQPKLLVPDLQLKAMNMKDEADLRQFYEALRASGVPISIKTRMVNVPAKLEDEMEQAKQEAIDRAIYDAETKKETYLALQAKGLPIPPELEAMFRPKANFPGQGNQSTPEDGPLPQQGVDDLTNPAIAPTEEDYANAPDPAAAAAGGNVVPLPRNQIMQRPPESDEQRAAMPKPARLVQIEGMNYEVPVEDVKVLATNEKGERTWMDVEEGRGHLMTGPRHIGMRRHSTLNKDEPMPEDEPKEESG